MDNDLCLFACSWQVVCHIAATIDTLNLIISEDMTSAIYSFRLEYFYCDITLWRTIEIIGTKDVSGYGNRCIVLSANSYVLCKFSGKGRTCTSISGDIGSLININGYITIYIDCSFGITQTTTKDITNLAAGQFNRSCIAGRSLSCSPGCIESPVILSS